MMSLPFETIWLVDFEYVSTDGNLPEPVCLVAKELRSGKLIRLWQDELPTVPPYPIDESALFVTYSAPAELGCHLVLGWPMPARVLDLYPELRAAWNPAKPPAGYGLLGALAAHGLTGISKAEKERGRALVLRGGPWSEGEKQATLDYCETDVTALEQLLPRMLPAILGREKGLGRALLRGRYQTSVARMEHVGVPVDVDTLEQLRANWSAIKLRLVAELDPKGEIFEGEHFREARFATWLEQQRISWPRHDSGRLDLTDETFKEMSLSYPQLRPVRELRHTLSQLRLSDLAVGRDGRNRVSLMPFQAKTGRNQPSNSKFIFGPSKWLRSLIKPDQGKVLAYIDWRAQEIGVAAALSGDEALLEAVKSGDPYISFAKMAKLAPDDATKSSHPAVRDLCKVLFLAVNYGMSATRLAGRHGIGVPEAKHLLDTIACVYPTLKSWSDNQVDVAMLEGSLQTRFGWPCWVLSDPNPKPGCDPGPNPRSVRNFPVQANANEMLRVACCLATEAGLRICCPVHDATLLEADEATAEDEIAACREVMAQASRVVLDGLELETEVATIRWPGRYVDERGGEMFGRITGLLREMEAPETYG